MLDRELLRRVLAPPPRLLFRERQLSRARELAGEGASFVVVGPVGTGKTTLVRAAVEGVEGVLYVDCSSSRTHQSLRRRLAPARLYVLDDYSLAQRTRALRELVRSLEPKAVVVHPPLVYEELEGLERVEMPPYTFQELEETCRERAARLNLPVDDEDVKEAARAGFEHGGNARIALLTLAERAVANALRLSGRGPARAPPGRLLP